jgi:uncharacterized membrane-anchored protein
MKRHLLLIIGLIILLLINIGIYTKEQILRRGTPLLLELAPRDPRSLMQGDYMALRYRIARDWHRLRPENPPDDGYLILNLDKNNVGSYAAIDQGQPLQPNQLRLRYRQRHNDLVVGSTAFFFEEGSANLYADARYGEFRVNDKGDGLLLSLHDDKFQILGVGHNATTSP